MMVETRRLGASERIDVPDERIFEFYPGLGAFEEHHNYALIIDDEESPIEWLQSLSDPDVCFPLIDPFSFQADYELAVPDADAKALGATTADDLLARAILTVRDPIEETTANLLAPIVLNAKTKLGRQILLQDSDYPIRAAVFGSLAAVASERTAKAA
jgi:flagellar assembly factor FliW